ncbi:LacI family DNA-binding transcriptional regulator [Streptomyces sp. NPDC098781]|uniref:LacI family DNA-binding transcriptional regulator n=1 Tax=Streptomyces sp. NPDC098781 TaxID=3366097 RepID=UPI0037FBB402
MTAANRRLTQHDIARMAGVSQTTVSLVLNNRPDGDVRISAETRERVLQVIRETGYVADPAARRLAERRNRILGVFTYEAVFPSTSADFYHPFLVGIEERAEKVGCDLLLFTSAKQAGGRRRIFSEDSRIRLADGCVLLGRSLDRGELARLLTEQVPFVSLGRRDDAGGPVPYVGADYTPAVRALVTQAHGLGHRRLAYVGAAAGAESLTDRYRGFRETIAELGADGVHFPQPDFEQLIRSGVTAVFVEESADGLALVQTARQRGVRVPEELSILALGALTRQVDVDVDLTGFAIPRREMGRRAVDLLMDVMQNGGAPQELLACTPVAGATLAPVHTTKGTNHHV